LADAWMPGARCIRAQIDGGQLEGGAPRVVWLTLGADPRIVSVWSAAQRLNQEDRPTHLVWDPLSGDIAQLLPIVRAGCALGMPEYLDYEPDRAPPRPASVNREGRLCVQIGVLGTPREPFTSFQMIGLAAILGWLDSWQIPRRWPAGQPAPYRRLPGPRVRQHRPRRHRHRPPDPVRRAHRERAAGTHEPGPHQRLPRPLAYHARAPRGDRLAVRLWVAGRRPRPGPGLWCRCASCCRCSWRGWWCVPGGPFRGVWTSRRCGIGIHGVSSLPQRPLVVAAPAPPARKRTPVTPVPPVPGRKAWMWHPRRINNMAGTSTPYTAGAAGRRARITSHGSLPGAQQHQEARRGARCLPMINLR